MRLCMARCGRSCQSVSKVLGTWRIRSCHFQVQPFWRPSSGTQTCNGNPRCLRSAKTRPVRGQARPRPRRCGRILFKEDGRNKVKPKVAPNTLPALPALHPIQMQPHPNQRALPRESYLAEDGCQPPTCGEDASPGQQRELLQ
mmetsp:Transcript_67563/g.161208  ORF Transcript_67563/g.161208 Transcript_67563/m.161208 type:complete len:143 (-) Transcript_67563:28-456(-)